MIINCQKCNKKFKVDDDLIPAQGRLLKCGNCGNSWFYENNKEKPKDLNNIIETSDNSSRELTPEEKDMLNNVIGFGESRVEDCMVPRADIVGLEININIKKY